MYIKKFDERSHKKCRYYRPDSRYRRYLRYSAARCQEQDHSGDDAYKIGDDPDILELSLFPCIAYDECDRIICGYAKISRHIESGSETYDHHSDHQTYHPYGDRRIYNDLLQVFVCELRDITEKKQIYKSRDTNVMSVENKCKQQKYRICYNIECPESDRNERIKSCHERLERIHAECGYLKYSDADRTDDDTY